MLSNIDHMVMVGFGNISSKKVEMNAGCTPYTTVNRSRYRQRQLQGYSTHLERNSQPASVLPIGCTDVHAGSALPISPHAQIWVVANLGFTCILGAPEPVTSYV
jgi:hypothetical protein